MGFSEMMNMPQNRIMRNKLRIDNFKKDLLNCQGNNQIEIVLILYQFEFFISLEKLIIKNVKVFQ